MKTHANSHTSTNGTCSNHAAAIQNPHDITESSAHRSWQAETTLCEIVMQLSGATKTASRIRQANVAWRDQTLKIACTYEITATKTSRVNGISISIKHMRFGWKISTGSDSTKFRSTLHIAQHCAVMRCRPHSTARKLLSAHLNGKNSGR